MGQRTHEQDKEIIQMQIDLHLPLIDAQTEIANKRAAAKKLKEEKKKDGKTPSKSCQKETLARQTASLSGFSKPSDLTVLREAASAEDSDLNSVNEERQHEEFKIPAFDDDSLESIEARRLETQQRLDRRKAKLEKETYIN